jgi:hypothetical protein
MKNNPEPCLCGAPDCPRCYPGNPFRSPEPSDRHIELAMDTVIDVLLDFGQWPPNGRAIFDLYDFLLENRDPSFAWEMYLASFSSNTEAFADRIERESKKVRCMIEDHLIDSDIVYDLASEYAAEEEDEQ